MNEKIKIVIEAEMKKFHNAMETGQSKIKDFVKNNKDGFKQTKEAFSKASDKIMSGLKTMGTALAGAATAVLALGASTQEYRNEQAKLQTAFETAGSSAEQAKTTYNDLYRVLGDGGTATEAAGHLAKLTTEEQALSEWTNICQGVYATFGDSIPIEGLTEAANETAKTGELTGSLADALNWAGVNEEEFSKQLEKCNSESEREKLIRETLNGLYDDASKKYEENNAQILAQNEAQSRLNDAMAGIGEAVAPINTALTEFGASLAEQVTPYIQQFAEEYGPKLKEVLEKVAEKVGEVIQWIADNWETIKTIATIVGAISAAIVIMNGVLTTLSVVMGIVNAVMMASPITWIILGITALIAAIILCIVYWDEIKAAVAGAWDWICEATGKAVDAVVDWVTDLWEEVCEWFSDMCDSVSEYVSDLWADVCQWFSDIYTEVCDIVADLWADVTGFFTDLWTDVTDIASDIWTDITGFFTDLWTDVTDVCNDLWTDVEGIFLDIYDFICDPIEEAVGAVTGFINDILDAFDIEWGLPEPSIPHFSVSGGKAPWGFMGQGSLPKVSIDWYAQGGVFDSPALFMGNGQLSGLGEDGAEAVVPLEKNTGWMNVLADELSSRMGTGQTIVMQVDGKTFGEVSVNSINQLTKQRGSLPLKLY